MIAYVYSNMLTRAGTTPVISRWKYQFYKTFWGAGSAAEEQSRRRAEMVVQGDGKFGP